MSYRNWLILILLFAAGLRLYALGRASFWYDEFGSLEASTGRGLAHLQLPLNQIISDPPHLTSLQNAPAAWRIWTSLDLDNHPPLYFLLLRFTRDVLGDSEWAVRLPSAICSLMSLIFFFGIVRRQLRLPAALAATALLAVAGSQITLAQEARPYALWLALSLACAWIITRLTPSPGTPGEGRGGDSSTFNVHHSAFANLPLPARLPEYQGRGQYCFTTWGILLVLLACASLLTHYLAAPILFSLFIYSAIRLDGKQRIVTLISIGMASILFAATWGPFFFRQLQSASANNAWQYDDAPHDMLRILWHLIQLPARWLSEPAANFAPLSLPIAVCSIYAIFRCRRQPGMLFWLLWSVPLIILITITDIARHAQSLFFMRYTFAAAPALCFLAGAYMQTVRQGWLVPAILGVLCLATLPAAYSQVMDWRNVAADLRSHVEPGDTIIFTPGDNPVSWSETAFLGIAHYAPEIRASVIILTDDTSNIVPEAFRSGHFTWVICTDPNVSPNALDPAARIIRTGLAKSLGGRVSQLSP